MQCRPPAVHPHDPATDGGFDLLIQAISMVECGFQAPVSGAGAFFSVVRDRTATGVERSKRPGWSIFRKLIAAILPTCRGKRSSSNGSDRELAGAGAWTF